MLRSTRTTLSSLLVLVPLVVAACGGGEIETNPAAATSTNKAGAGGGSAGGAGKAGASAGAAAAGAAGKAGTAGSGGNAGASGTGGKASGGAGAGGKAGQAGSGASAGTSGQGGASGSAGKAAGGVAGSAGAGGSGKCGDGVKNGALEKCDGSDLAGATCASVTNGTAPNGALDCFANCTFNTLACAAGGSGGAAGSGGATGSTCGNGKRDAGEPCEGADVGTATCQSELGDPGATGVVACFVNCTIDAGFCVPGAAGGAGGGGGGGAAGAAGGGAPSVCGDGAKTGSEGCDGADLGAVTCVTATGNATAMGTVACFPNCTLNLTLCSTPPSSSGSACGDGFKENLEQCDGVDFGAASCATLLGGGATGSLVCYANCTIDASACSVGGAGGAGGSAGSAGAAGSAGSAGKAACVVTSCLNHVYACGDCIDNDGDGLTDMEDPDCLGPCHNNEDKFSLGIPGANNAPCKQDCYYDYDSGAGNDDCQWDHKCDPLEVAPNFYPEGDGCKYNANTKVSPTLSCSQAYTTQSAACTSYCGPLTPNGCDCFGCCELPANGGKYVWLGSVDDKGNGTCKLGDEGDPTKCKPCTPVQACLNTCEKCELCLGKTTLPPECTPPVSTCGNGVTEGSEQCDGASVPATCADVTGNPVSTGTVLCAANCSFNGSGCDVPTVKCGDGVRTGLEQCDGADLGAATCISVTGEPTSTGALACLPNCLLDGSGCTLPPPGTGGAGGGPQASCGNGVREGNEQCDGADLAGATCVTVSGNPNSMGTVKCNANCTLDGSNCTTGGGSGPVCGNGVKETGEACDGNDVGAATCASATGDPDSVGTLKCFPNCTVDTGGCSTPPSGGGGTSGCGFQQCPPGRPACNVAAGCPCASSADFCLTGCCEPKP